VRSVRGSEDLEFECVLEDNSRNRDAKSLPKGSKEAIHSAGEGQSALETEA
jgi:hypothetical protein